MNGIFFFCIALNSSLPICRAGPKRAGGEAVGNGPEYVWRQCSAQHSGEATPSHLREQKGVLLFVMLLLLLFFVTF